MVLRCIGCEHEAITRMKLRKVYSCNHPRAQVRQGKQVRPRKMIAADHSCSPPWCPKRRDMKNKGGR